MLNMSIFATERKIQIPRITPKYIVILRGYAIFGVLDIDPKTKYYENKQQKALSRRPCL